MPDTKPEPTLRGLTFWPIPKVSAPEVAFGPRDGARAYFNRYDLPEVPRAYDALADELFFRGGQLPDLAPGVDWREAVPFLRALLIYRGVAHEAKMRTVAYALWVWTTPECLVPMSAPAEEVSP